MRRERCSASVLPLQKPKSNGMTSREYRSAAKGESWKFQTMNTIDRCMRRAADRDGFIREMERLGYQVRREFGRKYITYTHPNGKKVRDRKLHEEKYRKENMEHEFYIRQQTVNGGIEAAQSAAQDADRNITRTDRTGPPRRRPIPPRRNGTTASVTAGEAIDQCQTRSDIVRATGGPEQGLLPQLITGLYEGAAYIETP